MAGNATDALESLVIQHVLRIAAFPMPPALFVALCTTQSTDAAPGTEVVGGGYVRLAAAFSAVSNSVGANAATIEWPAATTNWGTVGWAELWSALSGGVRYFWLPLVDPADMVTPITKTVLSGDVMRIPAGALVVSVD